MSAEAVCGAVDAFFGRWNGASLKLPDGWFGRAYDNVHELTSASVSGETLTIELDDRHILSLVRPQSASVEDSTLRITGFERAHWSWAEYGSDIRHDEDYDGGAVEFVAGG
jgi:hypothetical protein